MLNIERRWEEITESIRLTVNLVSAFGYNRDRLVSTNALIPIAYYVLKRDAPHNVVQSALFKEDRNKIQNWLIVSLLKRAFSGSPDNVLRPIRQVIDRSHVEFPLAEIVEEFRGKPKALTFNDDEISNLFNYQYGSAYAFSTLAVLYPTLDFRNRFHLDHIFPRSFFKRRTLLKKGIGYDNLDFYLDEFDYLANLQLLEGLENIEKRDTEFNMWFESCITEDARRDYMYKHYIPKVELSLQNFEEFISERKKLMTARFESLLKI
jgi:hypothetical protein